MKQTAMRRFEYVLYDFSKRTQNPRAEAQKR